MALLKLYRGAVAPTNPAQGMIWFNNVTETVEGVEQVKNVIKVYTGTEWEVYGITDADLKALAARVATLEDVTIPDLESSLKALITAEETRAKGIEAGLETRLAAVEADYLKAADKTELSGAIAAEAARAAEAEGLLAGRLDVIEGEGEGSIKKAVADAKAAIEGTLADDDAKTLAALNDRIDEVAAEAKSYEMVKVETGLAANVKEQYQLVQKVGETSENVGEPIKIYKDSALQSAVLGTATVDGVEQDCLILTYLDVNGASQVVNIPVGDFLRESEFGNGLAVNAGIVSVGIREADADFAVAEEDQLNFSGAKTLISKGDADTLAAAKQYTDDSIAALDANVDSISTVEALPEGGTYDDPKIAINVVEADGVITEVNVTETDIASAAKLNEVEVVTSAALNDLNARMTTAEGSVADHETRLTQAEADIDALEGALANKNVAAESTTPDYVTATAADNKVTVAATQKVINAVALAETSVQTITSDNTCLTAVKTGNNVALSLVWEEGSF